MGLKLVIVDDAPFIREVLRYIFAETDIAVVAEAADGEEAIEMARRHQPDVILMDIVMPKKSGIEATKQILEEFPDMRIIACSTIDQNTMIMRALESGCCNYITKPFKADQVIHAVKAAKTSQPKEGKRG